MSPFSEDMQSQLLAMRDSWKRIVNSTKERFRPPDPVSSQDPGWPSSYPQDLGVQPNRVINCPKETLPSIVYCLEFTAARYVMTMHRTKSLFESKDARHTREMVAEHFPELWAGHEAPQSIWSWFEQTSGLYISVDAAVQQDQINLVPTMLVQMIWKLKQAIRHGTIKPATDLDATEHALQYEPYLDPDYLNSELHIDIHYSAAWSGRRQYTQRSTPKDTESAKAFAAEIKERTLPIDPYTGMAMCVACNASVTPGLTSEHYKKCHRLDGVEAVCPTCNKSFAEPKFLAQHRTLHCRGKSKVCQACKLIRPCQCMTRRDRVNEYIAQKILSATESQTGTIYDIHTSYSVPITMEELTQILQLAYEGTPLDDKIWTPAMDVVDLMDVNRASLNTSTTTSTPRKGGMDWKVTGLQCDRCHFKAGTQLEMTIHCQTAHTMLSDDMGVKDSSQVGSEQRAAYEDNDRTDQIQCTICAEQFLTATELEEHQDSVHLKCQVCDLMVADRIALRGHEQNVHGATARYQSQAYDSNTPYAKSRLQTQEGKTSLRDRYPPNEHQHKCKVCALVFYSEQTLTVHMLTTHQGHNGETRDHRNKYYKCIGCLEDITMKEYRAHMQNHPHMWRAIMPRATCHRCPIQTLESVAATVHHYMDMHRDEVALVINALISKGAYQDIDTEEVIRVLQPFMRQEESHPCTFHNCQRNFKDAMQLLLHKRESHSCATCGWEASYFGELEDHIKTHGLPKETFQCSRCGKRLGSTQDLIIHEGTHFMYKCSKCGVKFPSQLKASHHELSCRNVAGDDIYAATETTDPLMITLQCLSSLASNNPNIDPSIATLMQEQLKKAKVVVAQKDTTRSNFKRQHTFTYLTLPTFGPENTVMSYQTRDIQDLEKKHFSGSGTAEANYARLSALIKSLKDIAEARNLTENATTALLLKFLKTPASVFAEEYKEEHETVHGKHILPPFEDIVLYLEANFVRIRPEHAMEQLHQMKMAANESIMDLYIRAQSCAHFASFTINNEKERKLYKIKSIKETLLRNMPASKKLIIEKENLARTLRGETEFSPRQIVEHLRNLKQDERSNDFNKRRVDYTTVGALTTEGGTQGDIPREAKNDTGTHLVPKSGPPARKKSRGYPPTRGNHNKNREGFQGKAIGRNEGGNTYPPVGVKQVTQQGYGFPKGRGGTSGNSSRRGTNKGRGSSNFRPPQAQYGHFKNGNQIRQQNSRGDPHWVQEAHREVGKGCFKCAKIGHSHRECRTYKALAKGKCGKCRLGYHYVQECRALKQKSSTFRGANRVWIDPRIKEKRKGVASDNRKGVASDNRGDPQKPTAANRIEVVDQYYQTLLDAE